MDHRKLVNRVWTKEDELFIQDLAKREADAAELYSRFPKKNRNTVNNKVRRMGFRVSAGVVKQ